MGILALVLVAIGYFRGEGAHVVGTKNALVLLLQVLPLLLFAFMVAGMVQALLPHELIARWIGEESGWRGIFIGTIAGGFAPGGPYVTMPIAAGFLRTGASMGTLVAFFTAWSLWGFARLPMEVGIMGWQFTLARLASVFFFPPIAGWIAQSFFSGVKLI
jgi:uncharacterized membrane protein YraQ (UPF0718 family)